MKFQLKIREIFFCAKNEMHFAVFFCRKTKFLSAPPSAFFGKPNTGDDQRKGDNLKPL